MNADVLVLCGGLGTRLKPVTGDAPKVMAEVGGGPFLDFLVRYLVGEGARRIVLCAGYRAADLERHFRERFRAIDIVMSVEPEPLGTGGAFKHAAALVRTDTVFGLNGDCFTPVRYAELFAAHQAAGALATLVGVRVPDCRDFGTLDIADNGAIAAFREKAAVTGPGYINAGVYCFRREVLDMMPPGKFSIEVDFFPTLIGRGFYAHKLEAPFIDIGTPERFAWAQAHLNNMK